MKKSLFCTTAIATVGLAFAGSAQAEEPINLAITGWINNFFSFGDVEDQSAGVVDYNSTGLFSDGEIHLVGETTLDNGLTFGAEITLETFTSGDQIDDNYGYVEGAFGRLEFGSRASASYQMQYGAPFVGVPINSGWVTVFVPPNLFTAQGVIPGSGFYTPLLSTYIDFGDDENLITYYTPRFSGFQFGISYAPTITDTGDGKNFPVAADKDTEYHNGLSIGANFVESFNGIDVAVAAGYQRADAPSVSTAAGFLDDYQAWNAGINLGYAGFTVGGSIAQVVDGRDYRVFTGTFSTEGTSYDLGITYATGPWSFGVTYFHGEIERLVSRPLSDEMHALQGGVGYALGPGIDVSASILWAEWRDEFRNDAIIPSHNGVRDGLVGVVGITLSF